MKKIYLIGVFLIMLFSLCACGNETVVDEPPVSSEVVVPEDTEVDLGDNIVLKGAFLSEYSDPKFDGLDINKFLGTAIVKVRPEEYRQNDIPVISPDSPNADTVFSLLHLKPEYLSNYAISASSSSTRAYTVAVMQSAPYQEEYIMSAIETRVIDLYNQVKDYPDQIHLVKNAVVTQVGSFIVFIVCDNPKDVLAELESVMLNMDLNTVEVVPYMTEEERIAIENEVLKVETETIESEVSEIEPILPEEDETTESVENN